MLLGNNSQYSILFGIAEFFERIQNFDCCNVYDTYWAQIDTNELIIIVSKYLKVQHFSYFTPSLRLFSLSVVFNCAGHSTLLLSTIIFHEVDK